MTKQEFILTTLSLQIRYFFREINREREVERPSIHNIGDKSKLWKMYDTFLRKKYVALKLQRFLINLSYISLSF